jgi:hypothetical protein
MKTFEDAVRVVVQEGDSLEELESVGKSMMQDLNIRYDCLAKQATDDKRIGFMICIQADSVSSGALDMHSALFTTFMSGLIIGIEMEKQDFPPQKDASDQTDAPG